MKNLANCKPSEFLKQTNRIKKSVERWLTATDVLNIRKTLPVLSPVMDRMSSEERKQVRMENQRRIQDQSRENLSRMLDAILDEHPEETLELLALLCFVEPQDVDNHTMDEYLTAVGEMISNQAVISFFTSLAQLGLMDISKA